MAQQRESAPSGIGGLVRYEEEKSKVLMKPEYIFAGVAAISEIELVIQGLFFVAAAFGVLFGLMFYWMYGRGGFPKTRSEKAVSAKPVVSQPSVQGTPYAPQAQQPVQQSAAQQDAFR